MTDKGKILLIEMKGDHLENYESKQRLTLGRAWQNAAGNSFRYYMVFQGKNLALDGAYPFEKFLQILEDL